MTSVFMPFGKYKNLPVEDVPSAYLQWFAANVERAEWQIIDAIQEELSRRSYRHSSTNREGHIPAAVTLEAALQLIAEGRRSVARKNHPDLGGDSTRMLEANCTADWLKSLVSEVLPGVGR